MCVDANDIWTDHIEAYVPDNLSDIDGPRPADTTTGEQLQRALWAYINRRVDMDIATGALMHKFDR